MAMQSCLGRRAVVASNLDDRINGYSGEPLGRAVFQAVDEGAVGVQAQEVGGHAEHVDEEPALDLQVSRETLLPIFSPKKYALCSLTMTPVDMPEAVYTMAFGGVATGNMNA